jgi:RNA polymerase sigma factor (sigma-70 family)
VSVEEIYGMARHWAWRLAPPHMRDDAVQEAAIAGWRALQGFKGSGAVRLYLSVKIRYALIDYLRTEGHAGIRLMPKARPAELLEFDPERPGAADNNMDTRIEASQLWRRARIREDGRRVLRLLFVEGFTQAEAARARKVSEGRISQIKTEALAALREAAA